jgi:hypothetical protein
LKLAAAPAVAGRLGVKERCGFVIRPILRSGGPTKTEIKSRPEASKYAMCLQEVKLMVR